MQKRMSTESPEALNMYYSLHRLFDESGSQDALGLLEAAENCVGKFERIPLSWLIEGVKLLQNF
jgi:hypothetical protein